MGLLGNTCTTLAPLLAYPGANYQQQLQSAVHWLGQSEPQAAGHLAEYAASVAPESREAHEELYTHTFDINPAAALEIGWHLFGEDYHRGALLVRMRSELRRHDIPESSELPDHLSLALLLLDRMLPREAEAFAQACVIPALEKMLENFRGRENPYEHLLRAVHSAVVNQFAANPGKDATRE